MMEFGKSSCDLLSVCKNLEIKQIGSRMLLLGRGLLIRILFMVYEYNVIWADNIVL